MSRNLFDPTPEEQQIVLIEEAGLRKAEKLIESCEYCNPDVAEIPFDHILDRLTGSDPSVTDLFSGPLVDVAKLTVVNQDVAKFLRLHRTFFYSIFQNLTDNIATTVQN